MLRLELGERRMLLATRANAKGRRKTRVLPEGCAAVYAWRVRGLALAPADFALGAWRIRRPRLRSAKATGTSEVAFFNADVYPYVSRHSR